MVTRRSIVKRWGPAVVVASVSLVALGTAAADGAAVAKVGAAAVRGADVSERISTLPPSQRASFEGPEALKRHVLQELVLEELMVLGAEADAVASRADVEARIRSVLVSALLEDEWSRALQGAIGDAEVSAYYEAHRDEYRSQRRIRIWQVVFKSEEDARDALSFIATDPAYQNDPVAGWEKLARERSIDKTTAMRRGDLGFVHADGTTPHRDVRVPPSFFAAAAEVEDGEVVPEPVHAGEHWVVIQRRGAIVTPERSLASEAPTIRRILARERVRQGRQELVSRLRAEHLTEHHPERLKGFELPPGDDLAEAPSSQASAASSGRPRGMARPAGPPDDLR